MFPALPAPPEEISNNFFNLGGAPPMYPMHMRPPMPPRGPPRMMFMRGPPPPGKYPSFVLVLHGNMTLLNPLQGLLNCEIGGLDGRVITTRVSILCHRITM